ncbi:MAG: hypothetical protein M0Z52_07375 [Actinomycetota bacterium]|nr:hypothetical protein [Actinomycetota bacterium]
MFGSDQQNESLITAAVNTFLAAEIANITARFTQVKAILSSFPYTSAEIAALMARYDALAPIVQRTQSESPVQAEIDIQILKPEIDALLADTQMYLQQQKDIGETYYTGKPGAGNAYQPKSGYYYPSGSGPDTLSRELKQYPVKGVAIPAWLWLVGGAAALWLMSGKKAEL